MMLRIRLIGINWSDETKDIDLTEENNLFNILAQKSGINEKGEVISKDEPDYGGAVLAGYVKVNKTSTRIDAKYKSWWPNLDIGYTDYVTEYKAEFYNYNPLSGNNDLLHATVWGEYNQNCLVPTEPIRNSTIDTVFTYDGWKDQNGVSDIPSDKTEFTIFGDKIYYATYQETPRKYTVYWFDGNESSQEKEHASLTTVVKYGEGTNYTKGIPVKASSQGTHYLFSGWDKYVYKILPEEDGVDEFNQPKYKNDIYVTATFESSGAANSPVLLSQATPALINATCMSANSSLAKTVFSYGDKIDIELGWDPTKVPSLPDDRKPIFDLATSKYMVSRRTNTTGKYEEHEETITGPVVFNYCDEEGDIQYIDTGCSLFNQEEFTVILDYQFLNNRIHTWGNIKTTVPDAVPTLFDCSETSGNVIRILNNQFKYEVRVHNNKSQKINTNIRGGTSTLGIKYLDGGKFVDMPANTKNLIDWCCSHYDRLILRKRKDSTKLDIYISYCHLAADEKEYAADAQGIYEDVLSGSDGNGIKHIQLDFLNSSHSNTVILGTGRLNGAIKDSMRCNCRIDTCKIWKVALSDVEILKAANYPKENITMKLTQFPRFVNGQTGNNGWYPLVDSSSTYPGIMLETVDYLRNRRRPEGQFKDAEGAYQVRYPWQGWPNMGVKQWLNTRIYDAMPDIWKSAIKNVQVKYISDTNENWLNPTVNSAPSFLFVPAAAEYLPYYTKYSLVNDNDQYKLEAPCLVWGEDPGQGITESPKTKGFAFGKHYFNGFNRTRSPLFSGNYRTGYIRLENDNSLSPGSSANWKACVDFAFCI